MVFFSSCITKSKQTITKIIYINLCEKYGELKRHVKNPIVIGLDYL